LAFSTLKEHLDNIAKGKGADEINRSITDINDLVCASAARSEEINATSNALDGYARELEQQTGKFRVCVRGLKASIPIAEFPNGVLYLAIV
jgi:methyl-accepting chemotaxis protein